MLAGPAGVGKSTLVFSICKEYGIEVVEYMGDEVGGRGGGDDGGGGNRGAAAREWRG